MLRACWQPVDLKQWPPGSIKDLAQRLNWRSNEEWHPDTLNPHTRFLIKGFACACCSVWCILAIFWMFNILFLLKLIIISGLFWTFSPTIIFVPGYHFSFAALSLPVREYTVCIVVYGDFCLWYMVIFEIVYFQGQASMCRDGICIPGPLWDRLPFWGVCRSAYLRFRGPFSFLGREQNNYSWLHNFQDSVENEEGGSRVQKSGKHSAKNTKFYLLKTSTTYDI